MSLQSKHLLLDDITDSGTVNGDAYVMKNRGKKLIIVSGESFDSVVMETQSSTGDWVEIDGGDFTEPQARVIESIISEMTIRAVVTNGSSVTVEISE